MACSSKGANDRRRNQYAKILTLDTLTTQIAQYAEDTNIPGLLTAADVETERIPRGDFMTTVDLEAPHPWLSHYTEMAEIRFAIVVTKLLGKRPRALETCKSLAYAAGRKGAVSDFANMDEAYTYYTQNVLDGMPCDTTAVIRSESDTEITWEKVLDTHTTFWKNVGGNADNYYAIMTAYIEGLFGESDIHFSEEDHRIFHLTRRA